MSAVEETIKDTPNPGPNPAEAKKLPPDVTFVQRFVKFLDDTVKLLSSVRFGVIMLCIMVFLSVVGMVVIQQNVDGFEAWYAGLTPSEKLMGSWLLVFDIYHSWYFNGLLLLLSLNIILASIDHFPGAWTFISKRKLTASPIGLTGQPVHTVIETTAANEAELVEKVKAAFKHQGLRTVVTEKNGMQNVFGERGAWNRLGAYGVHVFLLTLFLGHFIALQTGFDADVRMMPGMETNQIQIIERIADPQKGLIVERYVAEPPFTIICTDIQQKLRDPNGSIDINNTIDWSTTIKIVDPIYGTTDAVVALNKPFAYRGYRFFQASAITQGSARSMNLEITPENGGEPINITLPRAGSVNLPDGTKVDYQAFYSDFYINQQGLPDTRSDQFNNAVALLQVTAPGSNEPLNAYAFANKLPDGIPIAAPVIGYKWRMTGYEKSPLAHVLSIKYDPWYGHIVAWYIGGFGVMIMLTLIYFFAHRRMWGVLEKTGEGKYKIHLGGNTNRNHFKFEDQFKKVTAELNR